MGKGHKHRQLDSCSTIQTIPELNISTQVNIVANYINDRLHTQIRGQTVKTTRCHHYHDASSRREPACQCINCLNITGARRPEEDIHELEIQDLVDEQQQADEYVDLSEDELHPGPDDEKTDLILQTVMGEDSTC